MSGGNHIKGSTDLIPVINKPKTRKRRAKKDEPKLRELIKTKISVMSYSSLSKYLTKELGYPVSQHRVSRVVQRMKAEEEGEFSEMFYSMKKAALNSFREYKKILSEAENLLREAYNIEELAYKAGQEYETVTDEDGEMAEIPVNVAKSQLKAKEKSAELKHRSLDKMLNSQSKIDDLFKMIGVYQEAAPRIDITATDQYKQMETGLLIYFQYVLKCPQCGMVGFDINNYLDFMQDVAKDPSMLNVYVNKNAAHNMAHTTHGDEAKKIIKEDYEDVEVVDAKEKK